MAVTIDGESSRAYAQRRHERVRKLSPVNNKRGAEAYERELREQLVGAERKALECREPTKVPTIEEFAEEFLSNYVKTNNKVGELFTKRGLINNHIIPAFGQRRLHDVKVRDVEAFKAAKLLGGFQPKSINNQLGVLRKMLRTAVDWELISVVPVIKPLRTKHPSFKFLTFDEVRLLLNAVEDEWRAMLVFALNTGLRLGELIALKWDHVNLQTKRLLVQENDWRGITGTPKGHRTRDIPLNKRVMEILLVHPKRGPLIFCQKDGTRLTYWNCHGPLARACEAAGVTKVQWHALRHTFASHLTIKGVPLKAVQELLGHASLEMTMRYAHLTPQARQSAVEVLE